jgi:hypothetical protein
MNLIPSPPLPGPASDHDWRLYGTVTIDGLTGGLAWKGAGDPIPLPMLE